MVSLNLPAFDYVLKKESGKVFILDVIRKKYLVLTPEEWVRQHFIHYLLTVLHYPKSLIKVEGGLSFNRLQKRSDIVVFNREGSPWMVIECKSPDQKLSQQTLHQASVYNHTLQAKYLVITNGLINVCCEIDWAAGKTIVLDEMPIYT
ncbi:MAG: restriction endonuclease subunit R [Marivirga sp.]|nr:restriction endonuclease subunit R [Marivirga sp.]